MSTPQGVNISGPIVPTDTEDIFPTHIDTWGKGGWRTVLNITERNLIPPERRSIGMIVVTSVDGQKYSLTSDLTTWTLLSTFASKTIVLGNNSSITTGTDVLTNLFSVPGNSTNIVILSSIKCNCRIADQPTIQSLIIDILVNNVSIWEGHPENLLTLPVNNNSLTVNNFVNDTFSGGDIITIDVIQADSQKVTIELEFLL